MLICSILPYFRFYITTSWGIMVANIFALFLFFRNRARSLAYQTVQIDSAESLLFTHKSQLKRVTDRRTDGQSEN